MVGMTRTGNQDKLMDACSTRSEEITERYNCTFRRLNIRVILQRESRYNRFIHGLRCMLYVVCHHTVLIIQIDVVVPSSMSSIRCDFCTFSHSMKLL
jgi:hypothetical protein